MKKTDIPFLEWSEPVLKSWDMIKTEYGEKLDALTGYEDTKLEEFLGYVTRRRGYPDTGEIFAIYEEFIRGLEKFHKGKLSLEDKLTIKNAMITTDKLTRETFHGLIPSQSIVDYGRRKSDNATVVYVFKYPEITDNMHIVGRPLTSFDKAVYMACAAIWDAGYEYCTMSQIARALGYKGHVSQEQINKLNESLSVMRGCELIVDNELETKAYPERTIFRYRGALLPSESAEAIKHGKTLKSVVHLFRQPPLIEFSEQHGQLYREPKEIFLLPINKTDVNMAIKDYLEWRICQMKGKRAQRRGVHKVILWDSLFDWCGITDKREKSRKKKIVRDILNEYKKTSFIIDFTEEQDKILINCK